MSNYPFKVICFTVSDFQREIGQKLMGVLFKVKKMRNVVKISTSNMWIEYGQFSF